MKFLLPALALAGQLSASPISLEERQSSVGNGPFAPAVCTHHQNSTSM
jgi:hypothetical protein